MLSILQAIPAPNHHWDPCSSRTSRKMRKFLIPCISQPLNTRMQMQNNYEMLHSHKVSPRRKSYVYITITCITKFSWLQQSQVYSDNQIYICKTPCCIKIKHQVVKMLCILKLKSAANIQFSPHIQTLN